jgi:ribosomal protein L1
MRPWDLERCDDEVANTADVAAFVSEQLAGATWHRTRDELVIRIPVTPESTRSWQDSGLLP